ncbi:hypothetical protein V8E51_013949, partial [Hyaloscypha variabilis]
MNLEQILENPGGSGYPHHAGLSEKDLETFAKRRAHDRTRVSELLADLDSAKLGDKYAWIPEYLSIRGNTKVDLLNLLVDQKYDGPFIYRPDNDTSGLKKNVQSLPSSSSTAGEIEVKNVTSTNSMGEESFPGKASTSSSSIYPSESHEAPRRNYELGIAGFLPERRPTSSLEHEYWLRDVSRRVEICTPLWPEDAKALQLSVVLGYRDPKTPPGATSDGELFSTADHILEVAVAVTRSISEYRYAGLCSIYLPVLMRQPADNAIEVFEIHFSEVNALTSSLSRLVDCLRKAIPERPRRRRQPQNPEVAQLARGARLMPRLSIWSLAAITASVLTAAIAAAIAAGYHELQRWTNMGQGSGQTAEAFPGAQSRIEDE